MFEFLISLCLATNIEGKPVNPCWVELSREVYRTEEQCNRSLLSQQAKLYQENNSDGVFPLLGGFCSKADGRS